MGWLTSQTLATNANATREQFTIRPVDADSGLYIEELAKVQLYFTSWYLTSYINLTIYNEEFEYINMSINKASDLCIDVQNFFLSGYSKYKDNCRSNIDQMKNMLEEIDEYNSKWFTKPLINEENQRKKRAPMLGEFVGDIFSGLFGTLNQRDANLYLAEFKRLHFKNQIQDTIIKKHTSYLQSTLNMLNNTILSQKDTVRKLTYNLQDIVRNTLKPHLIKEEQYTNVKAMLSELVEHITLLLIQFENKQKLFLNAITLGQNSPNNPNLLPPKMFMDEMSNIRSYILTKDLDLPLDNQTRNVSNVLSYFNSRITYYRESIDN